MAPRPHLWRGVGVLPRLTVVADREQLRLQYVSSQMHLLATQGETCSYLDGICLFVYLLSVSQQSAFYRYVQAFFYSLSRRVMNPWLL